MKFFLSFSHRVNYQFIKSMLDGQLRVRPLPWVSLLLLSLRSCPYSYPSFLSLFFGTQAISTALVPITAVFSLKGARAVGLKFCAKVPWETAANSKGHHLDLGRPHSSFCLFSSTCYMPLRQQLLVRAPGSWSVCLG